MVKFGLRNRPCLFDHQQFNYLSTYLALVIMGDQPATDNSSNTSNNNGRCHVRGCRVLGAQLLECSADGCSFGVHLMCYQGIILGHKNAALPDNCVACKKKCYDSIVKSRSASDSRGKWDCDGKNGPNDSHTSMKILLDWLTDEGNYVRFCGKDNDGVRKTQFANILAEKMRNETSSTNRNHKQVLDKIKRLEESFRTAHDFATSETGAGIQESQGSEKFEDLVKAKCPYYYHLVDIMADRSGTEPKITNRNPSDLMQFSDEEEEDNG